MIPVLCEDVICGFEKRLSPFKGRWIQAEEMMSRLWRAREKKNSSLIRKQKRKPNLASHLETQIWNLECLVNYDRSLIVVRRRGNG